MIQSHCSWKRKGANRNEQCLPKHTPKRDERVAITNDDRSQNTCDDVISDHLERGQKLPRSMMTSNSGNDVHEQL